MKLVRLIKMCLNERRNDSFCVQIGSKQGDAL
jgi:hypothetical protein